MLSDYGFGGIIKISNDITIWPLTQVIVNWLDFLSSLSKIIAQPDNVSVNEK